MNIAFTNARYNSVLQQIKKLDKVFKGVTEIKKNAEDFIFKDPKESDEHYDNRLKRLRFENYLSKSINNINSILFRKDYKIEINKKLEGFLENCDGEASSLKSFLIEHSKNSLKHGVSFVWVDFPETNAKNLYEFRNSGILPFLKNIKREDLLNFKTKVTNGKKILTQVVLKQNIEVEKNEFETESKEIYVVLRIGKGFIYEKVEGEFKLKSSWTNSLTYIPFFATYSQKVGFFDAELPFYDLTEMNISLMNITSDDTMIKARASRPIMCIFGLETTKREIILGLDDSLDFGNKLKNEAGLEVIGIDANTTKVNEKGIEELKRDLDKFSLSILNDKTFATATEANINSKNSSLFLVELSNSLESTVKNILDAAYDLMQLTKDYEFELNKDFDNTALAPELIDKVISLKNEGIISLDTVWDMLIKGEFINEIKDRDEELTKINKELEGL